MKNECGKYHYPSFSKTCCLRHLLEMSHYAQKLTLTKKYSKLLLTTLNHVYKEKAFNFAEMKLDLLLLLLDVISKFMGHFYMVQKYEYSKLLGIIATKALKETEDKIAITRQFYNDTVTSYNTLLQLFPNVIFANMFGFHDEKLFKASEEEKKNVRVQF